MKEFKYLEGKLSLIKDNNFQTINFRGHCIIDENDNTIAVCEDLNDAILMHKSKEMYNKLIQCYEYFSEQQTLYFGEFTDSIKEILELK